MNNCNLVQTQPKENVFRELAGVMEKDGNCGGRKALTEAQLSSLEEEEEEEDARLHFHSKR